MKRKLALFMAVVMIFSALPMNVFGARQGRIVDQINHPRDELGETTFRIDANALSRLRISDTNPQGKAVLEFIMDGGSNGSVGFVMPWDRNNNYYPIPFGDGNQGHTIWARTPGIGLRQFPAQNTSWRNMSSGDGRPRPAEWHEAMENQGVTSAALTAELRTLPLTDFTRPIIEFKAGPNFEISGTLPAAHIAMQDIEEVLAHLNTAVIEFPQTPSGTSSSTLYNRPGSNGWDWVGAPVSDNREHPAPHNVFLRQLQIVLAESGTKEFPPMNGWIDVTFRGIRAASDEATMSINLVEGGGNERTRSTDLLKEERFNVRWHNGVKISTVSVVPMESIAQLSGIKIQEDRVGGLLTMDTDPSPTANQRSYVRLVAPRGFRWDSGWGGNPTADDERLWEGRLQLRGNAAFTSPSGSGYRVEVIDMFMNEHSNRNELILEIQTPLRDDRFGGRTTPAEITIHGLNLIPVRNAATSGNIAIDVFVGGPGGGHPDGTFSGLGGDFTDGMARWGIGRPFHYPASVNNDPAHHYFRGNIAGSRWTEHQDGGQHWRETGLVVASFDFDGDIEVSGPANVSTVRSGEWTSEVIWETNNFSGNSSFLRAGDLLYKANNNSRWMNGSNYTLRISEIVPGSLYRSADRFELVPESEGVRIVDAQFRGGREGEVADLFNWGGFSAFGHNEQFVSSVGDFIDEDGSIEFFPRTAALDLQSRLRHLDVRLVLSVEAGHEYKYGDEIGIRVYRNGIYVDTAIVANVYDPIRIIPEEAKEIERNAFDVLRLTEVASFAIEEAEVGELDFGDEIRFRLQAVQSEREVNIPVGEMELWLSDPDTNTNESGFELRKLPGGQLGFRVQNTSQDVPGKFNIEQVHLAGPTVPGIEWHVVIYGPEISKNSHLILGDTDFTYGRFSNNLKRREWGRGEQSGTVINDNDQLPIEIERGRFDRMPYNAEVLKVVGLAVIEPGAPGSADPGPQGPQVGARRAFTRATMVDVDGASIQAVEFPTVATGVVSSMMNPRVFADFIGATVQWNEAAKTATFTGVDTHGNSQTVILQLDSPTATVNGVQVDIATGAGQGQLQGQIKPVVVNGRSYVPARFLASIFGVPIEFQSGTVILG